VCQPSKQFLLCAQRVNFEITKATFQPSRKKYIPVHLPPAIRPVLHGEDLPVIRLPESWSVGDENVMMKLSMVH
jgi:hypothetical protein